MLRVALHESMEVWDEHESVGEILLVNVSIKVVSLLKETSQCPVPFPIYSASTISIAGKASSNHKMLQCQKCRAKKAKNVFFHCSSPRHQCLKRTVSALTTSRQHHNSFNRM